MFSAEAAGGLFCDAAGVFSRVESVMISADAAGDVS